MAAAEQAARDRPRDLLLLLMRILIIALIAFAFDRPVWSSAGGKQRGPGEDVVVVLDASASMMRVERGRTLFEIARDRAIEQIENSAADGARVGVVIARLSPEALLPRLADDAGALDAMARDFECTLERAEMQAAIALACALPGPDQDPVSPRARRVVVYSDMQRAQWADVDPPRADGLTLELRIVGESAPTRNLAVTSVEVSPPRPIAGREAIMTARVVNYADAPARPMVTCMAGGREQSVSPNIAGAASDAGAGTATVSFPVVFDAPGQVRARIGVVDVSFTHDDAAYLVVDVRRARRIALVTSAPADDRAGGAYFIEAALMPGPPGHCEYEVVRLTPSEATPEMLASFDGAVIAEGGGLYDATLDALAGFILQGGGVIWVIDSQAAHESVARFGSANAAGAALPTEVTDRFTRLAGVERIALRAGEFESPALRALEGPAGWALLEATFGSYSPARAVRGVPLIEFAGGGPFIAWGAAGGAGAGRVVMIHADLAPARATLAKGPMFPVLMHELARFVLPASGGRPSAEVGEAVAARIDAGAAFIEPVSDDAGRAVRVSRGGAAFDPVLTGGPATAPGFVEFRDGSGRGVASAAVRLAESESDLRPMDEAAMSAIVGEGDDGLRTASAAPVTASRGVIELWPWMLAAALIMLMSESLVAGWSRRASRGRIEVAS